MQIVQDQEINGIARSVNVSQKSFERIRCHVCNLKQFCFKTNETEVEHSWRQRPDSWRPEWPYERQFFTLKIKSVDLSPNRVAKFWANFRRDCVVSDFSIRQLHFSDSDWVSSTRQQSVDVSFGSKLLAGFEEVFQTNELVIA